MVVAISHYLEEVVSSGFDVRTIKRVKQPFIVKILLKPIFLLSPFYNLNFKNQKPCRKMAIILAFKLLRSYGRSRFKARKKYE